MIQDRVNQERERTQVAFHCYKRALVLTYTACRDLQR